mmetsp:Transcript_18650/g.45043  ORF Transcript_18650/g.45043 Transcript_18650/m.45043 type:complete len:473 (-) Transcript_18650:156-1574(-)
MNNQQGRLVTLCIWFWVFQSCQVVVEGTATGASGGNGSRLFSFFSGMQQQSRQLRECDNEGVDVHSGMNLDSRNAQRSSSFGLSSSSSYTRIGRFQLPSFTAFKDQNTSINDKDSHNRSENSIMAVQPVGAVRTKKRVRRRKKRDQSKAAAVQEEVVANESLETIDEKDEVESLARQWTNPIIPNSLPFDRNKEDKDGGGSSTIPRWYDRVFRRDMIDSLASCGFDMATQEHNDWIEWKIHDSSRRLLEKADNDEMAVLESGEVLVYIGKAKCDGHGSKLPMIKTKSIIPLSSKDMADLLMDSSRVKIYNKMSVGRSDLRVLNNSDGENDDADNTASSSTKVVCNLTQPPVAKSKMVSCTLMHSRKLLDSSPIGVASPSSSCLQTHLVVSRAMPGMLSQADDPSLLELPRNDILLGVNLLQDLGPNECLMTTVTHVYSPALPSMLARSMGVTSAVNFVRDIRAACTDATTED